MTTTESRIEQLEILYPLVETIARAGSFQEICDAALEAAMKAFSTDMASLLIYDRRSIVRFHAWRRLSEAYRGRMEEYSPWTAEDADPQPIAISDIENEDSLGSLRPEMLAEGIRAVAFIPLVAYGRLLGRCIVYHREPRATTQSELRLGRAIAAHVAAASGRYREQELRAEFAKEVGHERARLKSLISTVPGVVWEASGRPDDPAQRINFVSDYIEEMLGYTVDRWLTTRNFWLSIVHPDDRERAAEEAAAIFASGSRGTSQFRWLKKNKDVIWVETHSVVVRDDEGRPIGMRGVTLDITSRKKAEESLHFLLRANEVLSSTLDYQSTVSALANLAVPFLADWCAVDVATEHSSMRRLAARHANPAKADLIKELMCYAPDASGAKNIWVTGKPFVRNEVTDEQILKATRDPRYAELIRDLGTASFLGVPLVARNRVLGVMSLASSQPFRYKQAELDLAELLARRAAIAIDNARLYEEAVDANRSKDDFLAMLSHELRTPMTATLGWVSLLQTGALEGPMLADALESIERSTKAQARIVDDILDTSRIITGKLRLDLAPVDLVQLVDESVNAILPSANLRSISVNVDVGSDIGVVNADAHRVRQVLWNLLSNAVKFNQEGGRIEVSVRREGNDLYIEVADTGVGIEANFIPYVFERFRQADSSTTRKQGGLGLGLAIVRHLVELHGGEVDARSQGKGHGARFTVRLPLAPLNLATAETSASSQSYALPDLSRLELLVIDDEPDARHVVSTMLARCGARVKTAGSAAEARGLLRGWTPAAIISDIAMPGEDGVSFIRQLRAEEEPATPKIPALALTAFARSDDREALLAAGYQAFVSKPVEPARLAAAILEIMSAS